MDALLLFLLLIIVIIILYKQYGKIYEHYPAIYGSQFNRAEDYKYYYVTEQELKECGIIKPDNKIKNWETLNNIYNVVIPDVLKRLNSQEYKDNPRYYYSQLYYDRKGSDMLKIPEDISIDLINQYMECAYLKNPLYKYK